MAESDKIITIKFYIEYFKIRSDSHLIFNRALGIILKFSKAKISKNTKKNLKN